MMKYLPDRKAWILLAFSVLVCISLVLRCAARGGLGHPEASVRPLHSRCVTAASSDSSSPISFLYSFRNTRNCERVLYRLLCSRWESSNSYGAVWHEKNLEGSMLYQWGWVFKNHTSNPRHNSYYLKKTKIWGLLSMNTLLSITGKISSTLNNPCCPTIVWSWWTLLKYFPKHPKPPQLIHSRQGILSGVFFNIL